jgi:hypothetical protein
MIEDWWRNNAENITVRPNCHNALLGAVFFSRQFSVVFFLHFMR